MKKSMISITLIIAIVLSFSTSVFAAFSHTSGNYNLAGGTIKFGQGIISNGSNYSDTLTIKLYRGNTLVSINTISLNAKQWIYAGVGTTPNIVLATNQPAGVYRYELSAYGSWQVLAQIHN
ncbi:hypothetical protein I6N90_18910 [Paenibacillus sp. GSMTC-2017]|nr:hypothetical protein [Paenibacillus sp. GSMTC-2017]